MTDTPPQQTPAPTPTAQAQSPQAAAGDGVIKLEIRKKNLIVIGIVAVVVLIFFGGAVAFIIHNINSSSQAVTGTYKSATSSYQRR